MDKENTNADKLHNIRHSLAHLLAIAVLEKDPTAKVGIGPVIDNGFYYDFEFSKGFTPDLKDIQKTMKKLIGRGLPFERSEATPEEAAARFKDQPYKLELIQELGKDGQTLSFYTTGDFVDLCRGGHVLSTKEINPDAFVITHTAGAYWRGDEKNPMLTRIYGLAFETPEELDAYQKQQEEAKKRDHRILGKEMGLFVFSELVGPGLPLWTPKGTFIRNKVNDFVQELRSAYKYGQVTIPHLTKKDLYVKSQHWEKYAEDLFKIETRDGHTLCMKPMNCPHHAQIYASELRSYKELPVRYSETTMVYRDEQSGELNGLSRVLSITQDDAHIFCREIQLREEINNIWNLIETFYGAFGFTGLTPRFSRRDNDPKFKGNIELWDKAEGAIRELLETRAKGAWVDGPGEAAFYGPKVDFMAKDALGRNHQVGTIQVDFVQPTNFGLEYVNEEGKREMPVMIHCAIAGSLERFMSVYLEHTAGNFPLWIAPTQVKIVPVGEKFEGYAKEVAALLENNNIRVEINDSNDSLGKRIRSAKVEKVPYVIVLGEKETESKTITAERRDGAHLDAIPLTDFISLATEEIKEKKIW